MAIRFDAAADRLVRTANLLDYNSNYTWMCWVRLTSDTGDYEAIMSLNTNDQTGDNDDEATADMTGGNNRWVLWVNDAGEGQENFGGAVSVGQWYHVCVVRSSSALLTLYVDGVSTVVNNYNIAGRIAVTRMEMGGWTTGNLTRLDGRVFATKAWSTDLSVAEIQNEMHIIRPQRTANLYGWWPGFLGATERDNDYSGNGYDWTQAGTLTDEDPPPASWGTGHVLPVGQAGVAESPSASPSLSPSASVSPSVSPSISPSASESPSESPSVSPSVSPSPSPGYTGYTRGDYAALPGDDTDLETVYIAQDILDVATKNNVRVCQNAAAEHAIHQYKNFVGADASADLEWEGQTNCAPVFSTVYLQIYNHNTTLWETVDSDNFSPVDTDFTLEGTIPDLTNYKDGSLVISCRIYQLAV